MNLTAKEIAYLSPSFTDRTDIGLFSNISAIPDGAEHASLTQKGVIKGNEYSKDALDILLQIAKPTRCSRFIAQNEFYVIEKYTYWNDGKIILSENRNGEFVFSKKEKFNDTIASLSEFFGMSNIKTSDISISLKIDEMLVLLAIVDIYRKNKLLNYAGKNDLLKDISMQEINSEISSGYENGIVKILVNNYGFKTPDTNEIPKLVETLINKNCLTNNNGYKLTAEYAVFATNFLKLESVVLIDAFEKAPDGKLIIDGGLFVVAGIHDIVSFVFGEDTVELNSASAFQMLTTAENAMACPQLVQAMPQPSLQTGSTEPSQTSTIPVSQDASGTWRCHCGKDNTANFCAACGTKKP